MRHYSMVFNTTIGGRRSIRVNNPVLGLPLEEISAAVDQLIAHNVFAPEKGGLESLARMELTTVERTVLF